ncbi:hypothetical protein ACOWXL_19815, partial [Klebsiella pneumoniae]|uniref:hypothetical protein n=1 Tax=Klebsiella pneumoniae TaxID=573 RepID=UPI002FE4A46B
QTETEATGAPQKHHYTLNQQVGSITPARMPIHFTFLCMQVRCLKRKHDRSQVLFLADVDRFPCALGIVALSDYS